MNKTFVAVLIAFVSLGIIINIAIDNPKFKNVTDEIEHSIKTNNLNHAEQLYLSALADKKNDLDFNYEYVSNHFSIPKKTKVGKSSYKYRDDSKIYDYYTQLTNSTDSTERDIGRYFLGLCFLCENDYHQAYINFKLVKNQNLKYLNNSLGNVFRRSEIEKAIAYYEKEIKLNGNLNGAVSNLSDILIETKDLKRFDKLISDSKIEYYIPLSNQRKYYYHKGDYISYFQTLWAMFIRSIDKYGFLGAFLIALIWLFYLRFIDVFEREKWYHISIVFVISSVFTYGSYLLYDLYDVTLGFTLNGQWLNDLNYCVFGIGLIEETIKLIPFILFLTFSNAINEPIDYVIYACVSAIGFSFTENILYFQNDSYHIMHGRALASVVGHMCDSSIVAYGFIVSRYKTKLPLLISVTTCLLIASLVHGLYDFWLLNDSVSDFSILTIVILISSVFIWNSVKNNALNNSPFFDQSKKLETTVISKYLFIALSFVFLFEYLIISINYGTSAGNRLLLNSILSGTFLLIFLTGKLARFELKKGIWESIKIWGSNKAK